MIHVGRVVDGFLAIGGATLVLGVAALLLVALALVGQYVVAWVRNRQRPPAPRVATACVLLVLCYLVGWAVMRP